MNKIALTLMISALVFVSGCATIVSGTEQYLTFQSTPEGAVVKLNGIKIGTTPLNTKIKKGNDQTLSFEKEGYKTFTTILGTEQDGMFWGNIIFGGLLGSTTDSVSGAAYEYAPDQYIITLQPENTALIEGDTYVSDRDKARLFLLISHDGFSKDLASGGGEYLEAAADLLSIDEGSKGVFIEEARSLKESHYDPASFVDSLLDRFLSRT